MFTGLIEATGSILELTPTGGAMRIVVSAPTLASKLGTGDSIAVSGVCLTALDIQTGRFSSDLAAETIARTSLSRLAEGSVVNLELPTPAGSPLGGHIVQGHVDGIGTLLALDPVNPSADRAQTDWSMRIRLPASVVRYVAEKGSIAIEGISLTVAQLAGDVVTIAVIPHTYSATNLRTLRAGDEVNIEADVLAKYAERRALASHKGFDLTVDYLLANGY